MFNLVAFRGNYLVAVREVWLHEIIQSKYRRVPVLLPVQQFAFVFGHLILPMALVRASSCFSAHLSRLAATLRASPAFICAAFLVLGMSKAPHLVVVRGFALAFVNTRTFV